MNAVEYLHSVQTLLANPERWMKGAHPTAKPNGTVCSVEDSPGKFTLEGAFLRVGYVTGADPRLPAAYILKAIHPLQNTSMRAFNNAVGTTHSTVFDMLTRAIRLAGGQKQHIVVRQEELE